jgi:glucosylceramidase
MVLDTQGGPNWFKNWCVAPVIVDPEKDEVYFTPLYYVLSHFSRYIRPGDVRIGHSNSDESLMATATEGKEHYTVVLFNEQSDIKTVSLELEGMKTEISIPSQAIQTILIPKSQF